MLCDGLPPSPSPKKRGARLIGISGAIYHVWARLRYDDCRGVLEARLDRPWFAAAPGKGAERAALEVSLAAEAASARDLHTASSAVDLKKFYEHITATDFAIGAIQVGIPLHIILLTSHLYTGPRLLRVRQAVADPLFPRRSVVAGCTWATVHVRVMMLLPLDRFQERIKAMAKQWDVQVRLTMYIDGGFAITTGSVDAVAFVHIWLSRMVIAFMEAVLKKPVAKEKLQCTASSAPLRASLSTSSSRVTVSKWERKRKSWGSTSRREKRRRVASSSWADSPNPSSASAGWRGCGNLAGTPGRWPNRESVPASCLAPPARDSDRAGCEHSGECREPSRG